jgi:hypothetical protein
VTPEGCTTAKELLDLYANALALFHKSQEPILAGIVPRHPDYPEIRAIRDNAHQEFLKMKRMYWEHVREHGWRSRGPSEPDFDWTN